MTYLGPRSDADDPRDPPPPTWEDLIKGEADGEFEPQDEPDDDSDFSDCT
jgi:hypothetical protein